MKKVFLAIALFAATTATTFAHPVSESTTSAERSFATALRSQIIFPEFLKEKEGTTDAEVAFKVTDCGTITIQNIDCDNLELRDYLLSESANFKLNTTGLDTHSVYKIVIKFQTL